MQLGASRETRTLNPFGTDFLGQHVYHSTTDALFAMHELYVHSTHCALTYFFRGLSHMKLKNGLRDRIRTCDPSVPGRELYQTELHTEKLHNMAEVVRFELTGPFEPPGFKAGAFGHSAKLPKHDGARGGTRTHRTLILSQVRLPITSHAQKILTWWIVRESNPPCPSAIPYQAR